MSVKIIAPQQSKARGYILLLASLPAAATFYLMVELLYREFPDIKGNQALLWSVIIGLIVLLPVELIPRSERQRFIFTFRQHTPAVVMSAMIEISIAWLWWYAFKLSSADLIAFLEQSSVLWVVVFGIAFLHERISKPMIGAIVVALGGFALISSLQGQISWMGAAMIQASAILVALNSVIIKKLAPNLHGLSFVAQKSIVFLPVHAAIVWLLGDLSLIPLAAIGVLLLAEIGWIVADACYLQAHRYLEIRTIGSVGLLEPVAVLLGMAIFFGESITLAKSVGCTLIIAGLYWYNLLDVSKSSI